MKPIFLSLTLLLSLLLLASCDENKGKAKEMATQFAQAVNSKDSTALKGLYPEGMRMSNTTLPEHIDVGDVEVEYNKEADEYQVSFGNSQHQKLILKADSADALRIADSWQILQFNSATLTLASKVGVPANDLSDIRLASLMDEKGKFVEYLQKGTALSDRLEVEASGYLFHEYDYDATLYYDVRNTSNDKISSEDYHIELEVYQQSVGALWEVIPVKGRDISAGGRAHFETLFKNGGEMAIAHDIVYNVRFVSNLPVVEQLSKLDSWTGTEYHIFSEARNTANGEKENEKK
jgi:hypothetical protein